MLRWPCSHHYYCICRNSINGWCRQYHMVLPTPYFNLHPVNHALCTTIDSSNCSTFSFTECLNKRSKREPIGTDVVISVDFDNLVCYLSLIVDFQMGNIEEIDGTVLANSVYDSQRENSDIYWRHQFRGHWRRSRTEKYLHLFIFDECLSKKLRLCKGDRKVTNEEKEYWSVDERESHSTVADNRTSEEDSDLLTDGKNWKLSKDLALVVQMIGSKNEDLSKRQGEHVKDLKERRIHEWCVKCGYHGEATNTFEQDVVYQPVNVWINPQITVSVY